MLNGLNKLLILLAAGKIMWSLMLFLKPSFEISAK